MDALHHYQNQMLFNLTVPSGPSNVAARFHRPEPIVFEKLSATQPLPNSVHPPKPAFHFSAVSEDKLSMAIQLARRDLKKKKEEEASLRLARAEKKTRKSRNSQLAKPFTVHGQENKDKLKKREARSGKQAVSVKETIGRHVKSTSGRSRRPKPLTVPDGILHISQDATSMPPRSLSPPTRDTDPYEDRIHQQDNRTLCEIKRLRHEITHCLEQVKHTQELARQGKINLAVERHPGEEDLPDGEVLRRHRAHAEEQERSLARQLYTLQQQVKQIQQHMDRNRPMKTTKRSQLLGRLAAAHRGTVKVLQSFVTHLQELNLRGGLPRLHRELEFLVRQLSLSCSQLEVAGESGVPDGVLDLIKDVAELNNKLEKEVYHSPPRPSSAPRSNELERKSPIRRELVDDKVPYGKHPFTKQRQYAAPNDHFEGQQARRTIVGPRTAERLARDVQLRGDVSPERQVALRQGIQALLRAADPINQDQSVGNIASVPPLRLPVGQQAKTKKPGVTWRIPTRPAPVVNNKKGLLLPSRLQKQRQKQDAQRLVVITEARYAVPTVSSQLKVVEPEDRPQPNSPPRTPRKDSNKGQRLIAWSDNSIDNAHNDAARQVWLDRQAMKHQQNMETGSLSGQERVDQLRKQFGHSPEWVAEAEDRIKSELYPLMEKAKEFSQLCESLHHKLNQQPHVKKTKRTDVEENADGLANMILGDLLEETMLEVESTMDDEEAGDEARKAIAAPTIETLVQRLHDMELEQNEIRRRWATIVYEEEERRPSRTRYFDASLSDQPTTPPPIEVYSKEKGAKRSSVDLTDSLPSWTPNADDGMIVFTKTQQKSKYSGALLHLSQQQKENSEEEIDVDQLLKRHEPRKLSLFMSPESVAHIHDNRDKFVAHLKQTSTQTVGRFNPWQIVEEVSNEILQECFEDVCQELDQINSDIADHVYQSEFRHVPGNTVITSPTLQNEDPPADLNQHEQSKDIIQGQGHILQSQGHGEDETVNTRLM